MFYYNTVCPGKLLWCFFDNGNVFFSQHILNKAKFHTQVLFCYLGHMVDLVPYIRPLGHMADLYTCISKGEGRASALEWPDGKWGLKSSYGMPTSHLLFHPLLCFSLLPN